MIQMIEYDLKNLDDLEKDSIFETRANCIS